MLAAMAALALFLVNQLQSSSQSMGAKYEKRIEELNRELEKLAGK